MLEAPDVVSGLGNHKKYKCIFGYEKKETEVYQGLVVRIMTGKSIVEHVPWVMNLINLECLDFHNITFMLGVAEKAPTFYSQYESISPLN